METMDDSAKGQIKHDYPTQVYSDPRDRPPEYLAYLERATDALKSVRIVVYAGMTAFILLAAYGFFLIYLLTSDAAIMAVQTQRMSAQMELMRSDIGAITATMGDMRSNIADMRSILLQMNQHMSAMDASTAHMAGTVTLIQHSARNIDSTFGPAMGAMNKFMPFGAGGNSYPGAPPFAPPPAH